MRLPKRMPRLGWRLQATRRLWQPGASPQMIFPPAPVPVGTMDAPLDGATLEREPTTIKGWVLFPKTATAHIDLFLGDRPLGRARLGIPRPDVSRLRDQWGAGVSGFELIADLGQWNGADGERPLRAVATSVDGESHELTANVEIVASEESSQAELPPLKPRTPQASGERRPRVLVFTHQLNLGGAQLYLLDLLRELVERDAIEATMVSAIDGSVRKEIEALGIPVHISSLVPFDDPSSHVGRIEELVAWISERSFDLAFVNTATALAFPGAEAADMLGIPTIWAIHESFPPPVLWSNVDPAIRARAETALGNAAAVIFEAEATQRLYEPPLAPGQGLTLPYGLDLEPIERERAGFEMDRARREADLPEDADVLVCIGTVEPRKAQIPLALAFDLIAERHPGAHLAFVGGGDNLDSEALADCIETSRWASRMRLIPITPDVHPWYALADLLVCASDVESLPRTVVEAMAFETPVLATNVFGLPELIEHGKTGWLCEPRDIPALAEALDRFLDTSRDERREVARAAREMVAERHSLPGYADEISKLFDRVVRDTAADPKRRIATG